MPQESVEGSRGAHVSFCSLRYRRQRKQASQILPVSLKRYGLDGQTGSWSRFVDFWAKVYNSNCSSSGGGGGRPPHHCWLSPSCSTPRSSERRSLLPLSLCLHVFSISACISRREGLAGCASAGLEAFSLAMCGTMALITSLLHPLFFADFFYLPTPFHQSLVFLRDVSVWFGLAKLVRPGSFSIASCRPGRGITRAEDAQGIPTQSYASPSILVYEDEP